MSPQVLLQQRFSEHVAALDLEPAGAHLLVAVSGGCDSVVLLHLLRFHSPRAFRLTVAHFDHRMRSGSGADAAWVQGLCAAWEVPLVRGEAENALHTEAEAREARYRFLRASAREVGASHIVTAHHADDQAETVLFRALRGTGIDGLAGMPPISGSGVVRPLLPFWRSEIERYARRRSLRWRRDPTNRTVQATRNRIRNQLLPWAERNVAPAARGALVRLADQARDEADAWEAVLDGMRALHVRVDGEVRVLARAPFRAYHPALGARLLRHVLREVGARVGHVGTRMALQFITGAPSGRRFLLPHGWQFVAEYDEVRLIRTAAPPDDDALLIQGDSASGAGTLRIGGRSYTVGWSREQAAAPPGAAAAAWTAAFAAGSLAFPLRVRGWAPGDRIRLQAGRRRLKKLFGDRRVPRSERSRIPLLVDRDGAVLWVAGVVQAPVSRPRPEEDALHLTIVHGTDHRDPGPHRRA